MKEFQISHFAELFEKVPETIEYSDIPDEDRDDFYIFLRLMEARTAKDVENISFEKILFFLDQMPRYVKYFVPTEQYIEKYRVPFFAAKSTSARRIL